MINMAWKDIIKNEPTILIEGLKNILDEALDEISDEEGAVYQGNKRIKHNGGSIRGKTGINFDYQFSKLHTQGKEWKGGFVGDSNESISEEIQRKILSVADKMPIYQYY